MKKSYWGIDLGGTKIEGIVLAADPAEPVLARLRLPTGQSKGYEYVLSQIVRLLSMLKETSGLEPEALGMGTPGIMDYGLGQLKNSNTVCLIGKPLHRDLEHLLGIPLSFDNDANCFALAETLLGAVPKHAPEASVVFGVIMGTGVGGGIVVDGKLLPGLHGIAGEWGHNFLDASGGPCYCGRQGCVETLISGPAVERHYASLTGRSLSLPAIVERHRSGEDPEASLAIRRLTDMFGKALAAFVNHLDPDIFVLGGGVGNVDELYTDGVAALRSHLFNHDFLTPVVPPVLGDSAGVFGAALLTVPPAELSAVASRLYSAL